MGVEEVTLAADLGQGDELEPVGRKPLNQVRVNRVVDANEYFVKDFPAPGDTLAKIVIPLYGFGASPNCQTVGRGSRGIRCGCSSQVARATIKSV